MKQAIDVSIIFVYYNTPKEILSAVSSIKKAVGDYNYEIIIVDNNSSNKLSERLLKQKNILYLKNENIGYGAGLNKGAKKAKGKFLLLTNADLIFTERSISLMIEKMNSDASLGIIGPQFLDEQKIIRKVGSGMPFLPYAIFSLSSINKIFPNNYFSKKYYMNGFDRKTERYIPALCGACMLIRANVFKKIKGFDERFFMYFEEADICYRVADIGYKVFYYPNSKVMHYVGRSSSDAGFIQRTFEHSRYVFFKKYHGVFWGTIGEIIIRMVNLPSRVL